VLEVIYQAEKRGRRWEVHRHQSDLIATKPPALPSSTCSTPDHPRLHTSCDPKPEPVATALGLRVITL